MYILFSNPQWGVLIHKMHTRARTPSGNTYPIQQATPVRSQGGVLCAAQGGKMKCEQEP